MTGRTRDEASARAGGWRTDRVVTSDGAVIPVRATAVRPGWDQLPAGVRQLVEDRSQAPVVAAESAGTGFTPGFASALTLANGKRIFVKAASAVADHENRFWLIDAYREEVRKLRLLPAGIGAPPLLWHVDTTLDGAPWVVTAFQHIDARPPRRPWRPEELSRVLDALARTALALACAPVELGLGRVEDDLLDGADLQLADIESHEGPSEWLDTVARLTAEAAPHLAGSSVVHLDLRDDNLLLDASGGVWVVDWNWPVLGAPWIDLVVLLVSAGGDGLDVEPLLADHPLSRTVSPRAIDCLLAVLWRLWAFGRYKAAPTSSPYLRVHQAWCADATRAWIEARLA